MPLKLQQRTKDIVLPILSCLGDHVLTAELEKALMDLSEKIIPGSIALFMAKIFKAILI